ncbi:uncharacterized protein LOC109821402 [Asparagus officinalis]|uniref:uncharacterized protein LOC109821402 n=1 Tax=Asparagus officinalis TaxID=4686 RepID=UPI00098E7148|nr:uncharacterized protein LOC109821402 [Asparagus officinalis]
MIDVWETEEWKTKSYKAKESRSKLPYNHISGSRSFAAAMSLIKSKNDGQAPSFPEFYKETHYQKKKKVWVNEKAQDTYEQLVNKTTEQSQSEVTSPMNEFEISIEVLGRRPGYLKGYGIHLRGSSSTRSLAKSAERDAEVVALKETVAVQAEQIASQAEQIASQAEQIASQAEQMNAQAEQMNAQAQKTAELEALVHQLFARSQPAASGGSRDFSSR